MNVLGYLKNIKLPTNTLYLPVKRTGKINKLYMYNVYIIQYPLFFCYSPMRICKYIIKEIKLE